MPKRPARAAVVPDLMAALRRSLEEAAERRAVREKHESEVRINSDACSRCGLPPMNHCDNCGGCPDTDCDDLRDYPDDED
jgi:hypothetical protein